MSDEESGGVRGLRTWAVDAVVRAKRLIPGLTPDAVVPRGGVVPRRDYDASVAELGQLVRLLDHDPVLLGQVSVWQGAALAMRHLAWRAEPADGERAEALLRRARDRGSALGASVSEEDRRWAALFLLSLVSPLPPQPGLAGAAPDLSAFVEWVRRAGPAGMMSATAEIQALTAEVAELPLPPELLGHVRRMRDLYAAPTGTGLSDLLTSMMPAGPGADRIRETMDRVFGTPPTTTATGGSATGRATTGRATAREGTPARASDEGTAAGGAASKAAAGGSGAAGAATGEGATGRAVGRAAASAGTAAGGAAGEGVTARASAEGTAAGPVTGEGTTGRASAEGTAAGGAASGVAAGAGAVVGATPSRAAAAGDTAGGGGTGWAAVGGGAEAAPPPLPGLTLDDFRRLAAAMDAVHATTHGLDEALNSEDPHRALNGLLRRLRSVQDRPPPGPDAAPALEAVRALLLNISQGAGGTHQDRSAGRAHMEAVRGHLDGLAGSLPPGMEDVDPSVMGRALQLYSRIMDAREAEDVQTLHGLVDEAEALEREVPEGDPFRFTVVLSLGAAYGGLGIVTRDRELLLRAVSYAQTGMSAVRDSSLPFADELPLPYLPDLGLLRVALAADGTPPATAPEDLPPHVPPPPGASTEDLHTSALSLSMRYAVTHRRADLDALIAELERVRDGVREGRAPRIAAEALWRLAQAYRERGVLDDDVKDLRALEAAREALGALAADVLLQSGAEDGLLTARTGASRGVEAALWAASQGRLHEAVAALELGRALVLHAASTSAAVPELLDARGRHDLAAAWREAAGTARERGAAGGAGVPGELPSTLRRQALEALGYRQEGGLLRTPTLSELADGVAESGADALLYLVPCEAGDAGVIIAVGPDIGAGVCVRPLLSGAESGPLERYLDATEAREAALRDHRTDPAGEQAWEEALTALCDWAFQVLDPFLAGLEERLAAGHEGEGDRAGEEDRPLRIVLVPCGRLGIVPWHAARFPAGAPYDHLCRRAVISYAASGSQFLRTLRRAPRDPAAAPVLLADPSMDLTHAEVEVMALRDAFYRRARMCGEISQLPDAELAAHGTPDDVLAFLAGSTSMLHIASHGSAGLRPTVSALHLADELGDPSDLTVTRLLDRPESGGAATDAPLVVLSACQTDLSTRDHDEALTLTTAFVSAGARDVVGSRWMARDGVSALLMAVFHHYLNVAGHSPVDALRAAQLWMLDPRRENPGSLRGELLREMRRPGLERIALWAPFIHQGHPGRSHTDAAKTEGRTA
ncbi:CHAT domain-containing protein [Streptomyces filipinensis]|uniref:CHAT domain-containing protein n=1 Tax=Streptomyces filipinensis TaxID=66887 RepID=UPI001E560A45|nr:CHAT domain-containing protein [Streptomyces filipinensis]